MISAAVLISAAIIIISIFKEKYQNRLAQKEDQDNETQSLRQCIIQRGKEDYFSESEQQTVDLYS